MTTKTHTATSDRQVDTETSHAVLSSAAANSANPKQEKKSLRNVFEKELNDIFDAEKQLVAALPELAKAAYSEDLQDAIYDHLEQTKKHVTRLEKIFARLSIEKNAEKCEAMAGLIEEGKKVVAEQPESIVRDSVLIIGAQKIEHYEIASYGSLAELADVLGLHNEADLLERTLGEEKETDALLTDLAEEVNDEAAELEH